MKSELRFTMPTKVLLQIWVIIIISSTRDPNEIISAISATFNNTQNLELLNKLDSAQNKYRDIHTQVVLPTCE